MIDHATRGRKLAPVPTTTATRVATAVLLAACEPADRAPPPPAARGADPPVAPADTTLSPPPPAWIGALGPMLIVAGDAPAEGVLLSLDGAPDAAAPLAAGDRVSVITPGGVSRTVTVRNAPPAEEAKRCDIWPVVRLGIRRDELAGWTVAVAPGRATPVALDSVAALPTRDSAATVAAIARAASMLPDDTIAGFRGLPFVVRVAWRVRVGGGSAAGAAGTTILIADVERRINLEADPRVERIALLAESRDAGRIDPVWHERAAGREDAVPTTDALAALRLGEGVGGQLALILARLDDTGSVYVILARAASGRWEPRWSSADRVC